LTQKDSEITSTKSPNYQILLTISATAAASDRAPGFNVDQPIKRSKKTPQSGG